MLDGASLTAVAAQVALDPDNARKQLRMYSRDPKRTGAADVRRIAAPIIAPTEAETKRRAGRRAQPAGDNVIPVAFTTSISA